MENKNKTLVILTPGFSTNEEDISDLLPQQLFVKALNQYYPALNIIIVSLTHPFVKSSHQWHNNRVISLPGTDMTKIKRPFVWFRTWKALKQLKKKNNLIGLLSFCCAEPALIGKYFSKYNALKNYIWICRQDAEKENRYIRFIRPYPEELISISDFLAREFYLNHAIKPRHIIPNGVDVSLFADKPPQKDIELLAVGPLIPQNQYHIFVEVVAEVIKENPFIHSLICGKGPEKNSLQFLIHKLNLEKHISFIDEISHSEILLLMQRSKIFLHTALVAGSGASCLEALYSGAQVISFSKSMSAWIKHWYIVQDQTEMAEKASEILQDPQTDYRPVLPYAIGNSATAILKLYDYGETNIS